ncbi:hypothetical protein K8I61_02670 [bacterium]|nr:hypothetical protein [bacterium]
MDIMDRMDKENLATRFGSRADACGANAARRFRVLLAAMFAAVAFLGFATVVLAADDLCLKRLAGTWNVETSGSGEQTAEKVFGPMSMTFDTDAKTMTAKIGPKEKPAKPFTFIGCETDAAVFDMANVKGETERVTIRFTGEGTADFTSADPRDKDRVIKLRRAP